MPVAHPLPVRKLGSDGLLSSQQGIGCMGMSMAYIDKHAPVTEENCIAVIDRALQLGCTHLDTSNIYGPETNERLIGKAIKGKRDKFMLATKCGIVSKDGKRGVDGSRKAIREACLASLERLQTDHIDLYYLHRVDRTLPIEESFKEFKALKEEGKIRHVGISEATSEEIRRAHAVTPLTAVQLEWSLWTRGAEKAVIPTCRELGIGIVPYSPLGRGFLTGTITSLKSLHENDFRVTAQPRFQGENFDKNLGLLKQLDSLAQKKGATPGQLALAWVHNQGSDVFPIPGTKRIKYLEENVAAAFIKLTAAELTDIETIFEEVSGPRYSEEMQKLSGDY
ncbi:hypothetical protein WJX84_001368 [Apatococcus fuscideae]|uniref:NADP-dependent oxidoreductase domain-containing protein n=1 Tax=Apatococcus fuscideae TaxID=2026836 RepID=A0AAW1TK89_9CHLO